MPAAIHLDEFVKQLEDSGILARGKVEALLAAEEHPQDAEELAFFSGPPAIDDFLLVGARRVLGYPPQPAGSEVAGSSSPSTGATADCTVTPQNTIATFTTKDS